MVIFTKEGNCYSSLYNRICLIINKEDRETLKDYQNIQKESMVFQNIFSKDLQIKVNDSWFTSSEIDKLEINKHDIQRICSMPNELKHYAVFPESFSLVSNYDLIRWMKS